jgi:hypothetical protein
MIMQELEIVWYEWAKQIYLINNSYFKISVITDCILVKIIPFLSEKLNKAFCKGQS